MVTGQQNTVLSRFIKLIIKDIATDSKTLPLVASMHPAGVSGYFTGIGTQCWHQGSERLVVIVLGH